jgi:hypothetical protein
MKQSKPHHELYRSDDCDKSHANFVLTDMEIAARNGDANKSARNIAGKWLSVFVKDGGPIYTWQGGYPTRFVSRETALSVLTHV